LQKIRHILVGLEVDVLGEEICAGSLAALDRARWLAKRSGAGVDVVHSLAGDRYAEREGRTYVVYHEGLSSELQHSIDEQLVRFHEVGVEARLRVRDESPPVAIGREALRCESDIVLIGKHDEREPGPRLGSVAVRVVRECPGAVWLVDPSVPLDPRVVLAATDLSPVGLKAVESAAWVAEAAGAELHVAHCFQISMADQLQGATDDASFERLSREALERVQEHVASANLGIEPELHVGCTSPVRGVLALEASLAPDLLVMGVISRAGLPGLLIGSTAEKVLPRVSCSLLTLKPDDFVTPLQAEDSEA